jgi:signal transduction histidine kinase
VISWRAAVPGVLIATSPAVREARIDAAAVRNDSAQRALATLSARLAAETEARNDRVRQLERASLIWNMLLVIAAFGGLSAVILLAVRERHALAAAEPRSGREVTLREAAEAMAAAFTLAEVMQRITDAGCRIADGRGAFIRQTVPGRTPAVVVRPRQPVATDPRIQPRCQDSDRRRRWIRRAAGRGDLWHPHGAADGGGRTDAAIDAFRPRAHRRLHELAKAETGCLGMDRELVDVNALLADMIIEYQATAHAGGLTLTARLDDHLPPVTTSGTRVKQIVSNLLSNAIKYTREGSVTVETLVHDADPAGIPGDWIQVQVSDTGLGISPDKLEYIFEEFSRVGPPDKSGAGLGLAISRLLAGALGGHITVESTPGVGSRFTLWLPFASSDVPATAAAS